MTKDFLCEKKREQLSLFRGHITEANDKINLVSRKDFSNQLDLLFEDALCSGQMLKPKLQNLETPVLDVGSGNGFPGVVCAVLYPETKFFLCEMNRKKAEFLKSLAFALGTANVEVLCMRAEETDSSFKRVLSQATAPFESFLKTLESILDPSEGEAFLWKNALWQRDWPDKTPFKAEVYGEYKKEGPSKKVLLKISRF